MLTHNFYYISILEKTSKEKWPSSGLRKFRNNFFLKKLSLSQILLPMQKKIFFLPHKFTKLFRKQVENSQII